MSSLIRFGVSVEEKLVEEFDRVIRDKGYTNRSEARRDLMRKELIAEEWRSGNKEVVGTLTIVYDHGLREVDRRLTQMQHDYHDSVISSLHVHLDESHCLEVVVLRGRATQVKKLADKLTSARGVKHGQLVMTSRGERLV